MQRNPTRLLSGELTTTAADFTYTSPALTRTTIAACSVTNKTGKVRYVTVTITPNGGTLAVTGSQTVSGGMTVTGTVGRVNRILPDGRAEIAVIVH